MAYARHPSYKGAKLSADQLIVVTDSVTLGSFFPIYSRKKGFLPGKKNCFPSEGKKYFSSDQNRKDCHQNNKHCEILSETCLLEEGQTNWCDIFAYLSLCELHYSEFSAIGVIIRDAI